MHALAAALSSPTHMLHPCCCAHASNSILLLVLPPAPAVNSVSVEFAHFFVGGALLRCPGSPNFAPTVTRTPLFSFCQRNIQISLRETREKNIHIVEQRAPACIGTSAKRSACTSNSMHQTKKKPQPKATLASSFWKRRNAERFACARNKAEAHALAR